MNNLVQLLSRDTRWRTAKSLRIFTGWQERAIRIMAEESDGLIISGQLGYRHVVHATPEEVDHFCNWMESQARRMQTRATRTRLQLI